MVPWINFTIFDIFNELTFNESLNCLETSQYHYCIKELFEFVKSGTWITAVRFSAWFDWLLMKCIPKSLRDVQAHHHYQILEMCNDD